MNNDIKRVLVNEDLFIVDRVLDNLDFSTDCNVVGVASTFDNVGYYSYSTDNIGMIKWIVFRDSFEEALLDAQKSYLLKIDNINKVKDYVKIMGMTLK